MLSNNLKAEFLTKMFQNKCVYFNDITWKLRDYIENGRDNEK